MFLSCDDVLLAGSKFVAVVISFVGDVEGAWQFEGVGARLGLGNLIICAHRTYLRGRIALGRPHKETAPHILNGSSNHFCNISALLYCNRLGSCSSKDVLYMGTMPTFSRFDSLFHWNMPYASFCLAAPEILLVGNLVTMVLEIDHCASWDC